MEPLRGLVGSGSKVLVAFDDNARPCPPLKPPDLRRIAVETVVAELVRCGVDGGSIELVAATGLGRRLRPGELRQLLGPRLMATFHPARLRCHDACDRDGLVRLERTADNEVVETARAVVDADLVICVGCVQLPRDGGHAAVTAGFGSYRSHAEHSSPHLTSLSPHVMQPDGSAMHAVLARMSRVIRQHTPVLLLELPLNSARHPPPLRSLDEPPERSGLRNRFAAPLLHQAAGIAPPGLRRAVAARLRSHSLPLAVHAGAIDEVYAATQNALKRQLAVPYAGEADVLVVGTGAWSPHTASLRQSPVLAVSDALNYGFNCFYGRPFVRKGGAAIILNPAAGEPHQEDDPAYRRFYEQALDGAADPFTVQSRCQEDFANDPELVAAYRERHAYHPFHPFAAWYQATWPLTYLSRVLLVGPADDRVAKRIGVGWAPSLSTALGMAREAAAGDRVVAMTVPPFRYPKPA